MSIKQGSHEPVSAYCSRFRRTLLQLQSAQDSVLPDLTVVTWFQEGLRPEFQVELERDQPSKFTDAVRSAEKAESICQRTRSPVAEGIDHTECFVVHRSLPQKPSGSSRAQAAPITSSVTNPPDTQSTQLLQQVIVQQSRLLAQQGEVLKLLQTQSLSPPAPVQGFSSTYQSASSTSGFRGAYLYCRKYGHRIADCRKRLAKEAKTCQQTQTTSPPVTVPNQQPPTSDRPQQTENRTVNQQLQPPQRQDPVYALQLDDQQNTTRQASAVPTCTLTVEGAEPTTCIIDSGAVPSLVSSDFVNGLGQDVDQSSTSCSTPSYRC